MLKDVERILIGEKELDEITSRLAEQINNDYKNSGEIKIHLDLMREELEKYDLLIIEDIVDSGRTLSRLTQLLKNRNANSVKTCTLLDKPSRREVEFTPDYCGTQIEDEFVIGYGLDFNEKYRNLP